MTFWDDTPADGPPTDVTVRFVGIRRDVDEESESPDTFERFVTVSGVPAGAGRLAVTAKVSDIAPGRWDVAAARAEPPTGERWSPVQTERLATTFAPFAHGPAVRLWSWPALVGAGALLALLLQFVLLTFIQGNPAAALGISALACLLGYAGAKVYTVVLNRESFGRILQTGACIQGFLLVAFAVLALGSAVAGLGVGPVLDATTPGLFLGMAVGRPGCFLSGCCAGRATSSRWGLWSSDRSVAIRRVPVQLMEAAAAAVIGAVTLGLFVGLGDMGGGLFVGGLAVYVLARQGLFGLRANPRTARGRALTVGLGLLVLAADFVVVAGMW
ncbi:prolipoprotein diacylglyceryl transferase family protein [Nocardia sp. NBC_01388]|uniref:prolipoprotein diacylglyceryl transferase family protein n=1 Tax=Nocardia sp. NBC_01388 TaxID=2903596 RepID=UPI00324FCC95